MKKSIVYLAIVLVLCFVGTAAALDIDADSNDKVDTLYGGTNRAICADGEILVSTGAAYDCVTSVDTDDDGDADTIDSAAVLLNTIANPSGAKTFVMGAHELTFGSATDGWFGITISSSNAALSTETALLTLSHADADDTNQTWFDFKDGGGTVLKMTGVAGGAQITAGAGGTTKIYASALDYDSIDNLTIGGTSINDLDMGFTVGQTFTTITASGAIKGALAVYAAADITSDTFVGQEDALRGTLVTNQGDADGETWELPVCTSPTAGFHAKILCAAAQDIVLDAGAASTIYVSDGTNIVNAQADDDNVTLDCANVGESAIIYSFSTDGSTCDWMVECGAGTCTEGA